jgi:hypothetical protein
VITLGTPHRGVGYTLARIGAINWSSYMFTEASQLIDSSLLRKHMTYRNLLEWAVRESMRDQSAYNTLITGVPSEISQARLFATNNISLYTLAGNNKSGLANLYIEDSSKAFVADIFKNILLSMIYDSNRSKESEPVEHDGLVRVESALGQPEAKQTATVDLNHNDVALENNDAFSWCVTWLKE